MTSSRTSRTTVRRIGYANPVALENAAEDNSRGFARSNAPDNMYGGCSVQIFDSNTGAGNLSHTHEDANGFLDYVNQFDQIDFHFEDGGVQEWEYDPVYDDWQNFYGMDAVRTFYHSGHGGMEGDGTFFAPLGARWNGNDYALSSSMSIGDQFLRYLFWSTCNSLEVLNGQSPIKTWNAVNRGLRMIFGFQSTSVDSPDYGKNFFSEWNKGKSFSQAWQDASLDISTNQQVSSTACGSTEAECQDRLWNERLFFGGSASAAWYWWRWAGNAPLSVIRTPNRALPAARMSARLVRRTADGSALDALLDRYGMRAGPEVPDGVGDVSVEAEDRRVVLHADGSHEAFLAEPNREAPLATEDQLRAAAENAIQHFGVAEGLDLVYDRMTATYHAGGSIGGEVRDTQIADVTVHYRQLVDGVPVVMGREGHVRVTLDASGTLTRVLDRTHAIRDLLPAAPRSDDITDPEAALTDGTQALLRALSANGVVHDRVDSLPNTTEIGYRFKSGEGVLVARREVEISTGRFRKRHVIEVPL